jgi:hypothetical protein
MIPFLNSLIYRCGQYFEAKDAARKGVASHQYEYHTLPPVKTLPGARRKHFGSSSHDWRGTRLYLAGASGLQFG